MFDPRGRVFAVDRYIAAMNRSDNINGSAHVIGIDIGGTNMQFGVVDSSNRIIGRASAKTEPREGLEHVIDNLADGVDRACQAAGLPLEEIGAVGIVAAGAIDIPRGVVLVAPNLYWENVPLRDLVRERLQRPVVLDNDVNGATWGEYHLGAGDGAGNALGVWVGTGVGSGIIINSRIHHGDFFTAGELGHTVINPSEEPGRRTLESICSRTGMRKTFRASLNEHPASIIHELTGGDIDRLGAEEISLAYEAGDQLAVSIVDLSADFLGTAIANLVTYLAPRTIILGGGMTEALGQPYVDRIRKSFDHDVFPNRCRDCRLVMTRLAADSGLLGAALLARTEVPKR